MQTHIIYSGYLSAKAKNHKMTTKIYMFLVGMVGWSFWVSLVAQMEKICLSSRNDWSSGSESPLENNDPLHISLI